MTTTAECTIDVGIADLLHAITAVIPHADKPKLGDDTLALARVRLIAGADELHVIATNGRTTAAGSVDIEEDSRAERFSADDGEFSVDIHPKMLRQIASGLTPVKVDGEVDGWARLTFTTETLTAVDVSGLWPGSSTQRPLLALNGDYPDVLDVHKAALANASGTYKPMVTRERTVGLFETAQKAYGEDLVLEPTGTAESRGWLVLCGPAFCGTMSSLHADGDSLNRRDKLRRRHMERLGLALRAVG